MQQQNQQPTRLTPYQKIVILILALTQFTVILDFMVMNPLADFMMKSMDMKTSGFGFAVSAYAFSAGISGLLTAGFADKFDRKKLLLFFYIGFVAGTVLCGLANSYEVLVIARIVTGLFGGVIGSIGMAIIADIFTIQQRGRVMGFVQMGFAASQILGIPIGIALASNFNWHVPFIAVAGFAALVLLLIVFKLKPVTAHLGVQTDKSPLKHLLHTVVKKDYRIGFAATALLSVGGFMMMPFGTAFAINNLHISPHNKIFLGIDELTLLFIVAGIGSMFVMPLIGKLSDKIDKFKIFAIASAWMIVMVIFYTNLGPTPLWQVMVLNVLMMGGVMSRMIPSQALVTAVPEMRDRGAFMSINTSLQQLAGGVAAAVAGLIVAQKDKQSPLEHYDTLGYIISVVTIVGVYLIYRVSVLVKKKTAERAAAGQVTVVQPEAIAEM
ncbi:MAG TPA: MFS transporter [Chitinophagaceae bacterium]|jgi:predicted MFS family arabinose efflux permease|nr:MFS transporter [Chitinophagaceae bacterium]